MDGDARSSSNRTVAQEASNMNGNKNANTKNQHKVKQVRLSEIQKKTKDT